MDANANFTLNVSDNVTIYLTVNTLSLNADGYYNNTVKVSLLKFKTELIAADVFVKNYINDMTSDGLSINSLIEKIPVLKFFNLTEMELVIENDYAMAAITP